MQKNHPKLKFVLLHKKTPAVYQQTCHIYLSEIIKIIEIIFELLSKLKLKTCSFHALAIKKAEQQ